MLQEFDPSNEKHVTWLKKLICANVNDKVKIFRDNPLKAKTPDFEMIQIIFALSMKYTKAVFEKTACILD